MFPSSPVGLIVTSLSQTRLIKIVLYGERWIRAFSISSPLLEAVPSTRQTSEPHKDLSAHTKAGANLKSPSNTTSIRVREVEISCEELIDKSRLRIQSASWTPSADPLLVVLFSDNFLRCHFLHRFFIPCFETHISILLMFSA